MRARRFVALGLALLLVLPQGLPAALVVHHAHESRSVHTCCTGEVCFCRCDHGAHGDHARKAAAHAHASLDDHPQRPDVALCGCTRPGAFSPGLSIIGKFVQIETAATARLPQSSSSYAALRAEAPDGRAAEIFHPPQRRVQARRAAA